MKTIQHFVDGKSFAGESKRNGKVFNPATGEQIAQVKLATKKVMFLLSIANWVIFLGFSAKTGNAKCVCVFFFSAKHRPYSRYLPNLSVKNGRSTLVIFKMHNSL